MLAEIVRTMAAADFPSRWPELLPTLVQALAHAAIPAGQDGSTGTTRTQEEPGTPDTNKSSTNKEGAPLAAKRLPLEQVLVVLATISKQFVWFRDTTSDKPASAAASKEQSAAPEELNEFVGKDVVLWNNMFQLFDSCVRSAIASILSFILVTGFCSVLCHCHFSFP